LFKDFKEINNKVNANFDFKPNQLFAAIKGKIRSSVKLKEAANEDI